MKKITKIVLILILIFTSFSITSAYKYDTINNYLGKYYAKLDNNISDTQKKIDTLEKIKDKIDKVFKFKWDNLSIKNKQLLMLIKSSLVNKIRFYEKELEEIDISDLFWEIEEERKIFYNNWILKWTWTKKWYYTVISLERDVIDNTVSLSEENLILSKNEINLKDIFKDNFLENGKYKVKISILNSYKNKVDYLFWNININWIYNYSKIWYKIIWDDILLNWVSWDKNIIFNYVVIWKSWGLWLSIINRDNYYKDTLLIKWWASILSEKFKNEKLWYIFIEGTKNSNFLTNIDWRMDVKYINSYWRFYTKDLLENIKREENNISVKNINISFDWDKTLTWNKLQWDYTYDLFIWDFWAIVWGKNKWKIYYSRLCKNKNRSSNKNRSFSL